MLSLNWGPANWNKEESGLTLDGVRQMCGVDISVTRPQQKRAGGHRRLSITLIHHLGIFDYGSLSSSCAVWHNKWDPKEKWKSELY